jgi:hypothetical protein
MGLESLVDKLCKPLKRWGNALRVGVTAVTLGASLWLLNAAPWPKPAEKPVITNQLPEPYQRFLPWAIAMSACATTAGLLLYRDAFRMRKSHQAMFENHYDKLGVLDYLVRYSTATGSVPFALAAGNLAAQIAVKGFTYSVLDSLTVASPALAYPFLASSLLTMGLTNASMFRAPIFKHFIPGIRSLLKGSNIIRKGSLDDYLEHQSDLQQHVRFKSVGPAVYRAAKLLANGSQEEGYRKLEESVLELAKIERAREATHTSMLGTLVVPAVRPLLQRWYAPQQFDDHASLVFSLLNLPFEPARHAEKCMSSYVQEHPERKEDANVLATFLFSAFGKHDLAATYIHELARNAVHEQIGDYSVFRVPVKALRNRPFILKRHAAREPLLAEQEQLEYFSLHNLAQGVSAAWPLGVYETPSGMFLAETYATGETAYDALAQNPALETLESLFGALASVHEVMPRPEHAPSVEEYAEKLTLLDRALAYPARRLFLASTRAPIVFDKDAHLDNFGVSEQGITIYDMQPRSGLPPEHDVARMIGLLPASFTHHDIDSAIARGYTENVGSLGERTVNEFIRSVHVAVPVRALSYAAAMRSRPAMHGRARAFLERAEQYSRLLVESHSQVETAAAELAQELPRVKEQFSH